jgi:hypothetical protein
MVVANPDAGVNRDDEQRGGRSADLIKRAAATAAVAWTAPLIIDSLHRPRFLSPTLDREHTFA